MPAYVISEVEIRDAAAVAAYKPLAELSVRDHGGEYLARDAVPEALEGGFAPGERLVVLRFPDVRTAREWYASAAYQRAVEVAAGGLHRRLFIVEGL